MRKISSKLLVLLSIICILSLLALGCIESIPEETLPETTLQTVTEAVETESAEPEFYDIISGGVCSYKIVYPANLPTDDAQVKTALNIRKSIERFTTATVEIGDDFIKDGESYNGESLEILIGQTAYPETAKVSEELGYGDYVIQAVGNKIVVLSYSDDGYTAATNRFASLLYFAP